MARSVSQSGQAPCPECGRPVPLEIWLVVDTAERPDLAARVGEGTIHTVLCPHCGHEGQVDAPLLVHDSERRRVFFVPPRQTSEEEDRQLASALLDRLAETFLHPRPAYLEQVQGVPRELLPALLAADDPQAVLEAAARQAMAQASPLLAELRSFIAAGSWAESRRVVEEHPELLADEADVLLGQLLDGAQAQGDETASRVLEEHRTLLRRCRQLGVATAFAEKTGASRDLGDVSLPDGVPPEARAALEALSALPPDLRDALAELVGRVSSPEALEAALAQRPELRAALEAALAGVVGDTGPAVPPQFGVDLRQAKEAERRYRRTGDGRALDEAAAAWQRIWDHPAFGAAALEFRLAALNDGAGVLLRRYWARGQIEDLSVALRCWETAVAQTPAGSPDLPGYLNNLGNGLRARYARTGDLADLAGAIEAYEQAVAQTPAGSPEKAAILNNLGTGLRARYARTGDLADLAGAIEAYEQACRRGQEVALEEALRAARNWGGWALERKEWAEAARAYGHGLEASEQLFRRQLLRASKEAWLRAARGLHARAAYALARSGDLAQAVEALEGGRARLLAQVLERDRADLSQLETLAPAAYRQYAAAAGQLQALETEEIGGQPLLPAGQTLTDLLRQGRAALDAAVEAIRQVPGYAGFLAPLSLAQIQGQAGGGRGLVYLAVAPAGALALIVRGQPPSGRAPSTGAKAAVACLWLDELTEGGLRERVQGPDDDPELGGYLGAYARWRVASRDPAARAAWFAALDGTTRWLWDVLVGPLVETLPGLGVERAILVPQGWLGLLPLHAAWTEGPGHRRYALDEVCFTYAPNALALQSARQKAARVRPESLLAVDEPQPVSAIRLPNSPQEVAAACSHFTPHRREVLRGGDATRESVSRVMQDYAVLHFSCHGLAGFARPLEGGLLMADDEMLTLRHILALRLDNARLAVLSACETGVPGTDLPDEVVSLPTGLAQAGVAGVVASLWSVSDLSTMMLMTRFYELWQREGLDPAEALRQAQFWVRDTNNGQKAEYFKGFLPEFQARRLPFHVADALYRALFWARPEDNDFEHPFYWAAFSYTGV